MEAEEYGARSRTRGGMGAPSAGTTENSPRQLLLLRVRGALEHKAESLRGPPILGTSYTPPLLEAACALFLANEGSGLASSVGNTADGRTERHTEKAAVTITLAGADGSVPASCPSVLRGLELQQPPCDPGVTHVEDGMPTTVEKGILKDVDD